MSSDEDDIQTMERRTVVSTVTPSDFAPSRDPSPDDYQGSPPPPSSRRPKTTPKVTPKKRKAEPTTTTTSSRKLTDSEHKARRKANVRPNKSLALARSYQECEEWDKKLIDMREAGEEWAAIREMWREVTGEEPCGSTLPNRYIRLKSNFTIIKEEDNAILIRAKQEADTQWETEKWERISAALVTAGCDEYEPDVLRRQYTKLYKNFEHKALIDYAREQAKARVEGMRERKASLVEDVVRQTIEEVMHEAGEGGMELGGEE